jgi:hypothetical protein
MTRVHRLLFGPISGVIFFLGAGALASMVPGYSHVHQTVSEIGEMGSPARTEFAILMCCVAVCVLVFAFPHPLHNVFGISELIGYQAPLGIALAWRGVPGAKKLVIFSWVMLLLVWLAIAVNFGSMARHSALWAYERPIYGLVQRSLFVAWFGWCAVAGWLLWRREDTGSIS